MKWLIRISVAGVALALAGLLLLAWAVPRLAKSEAVRARIQSESQAALGRELRYAELDFGLLPPSLRVIEPTLAGDSESDPPLARASRVELRARLFPLLTGRLEVQSLVVDELALRLVRSDEGLVLRGPIGAPEPEEPAAPPDGDETEAPTEEPGGAGAEDVALGIRRVVLRDASLMLEDRAVSPAVTWHVENIQLDARRPAADRPVEFEGSLRLTGGGELELGGRADTDGGLEVGVELRSLALVMLEPYAGRRLSGRIGGEIDVSGAIADPALSGTLRIEDAELVAGGVEFEGPVSIDFDLEQARSAPRGPFEVDARGARLAYGADFRKAPGTPARVRGNLHSDAGALAVDDLEIELRNAVARGELRTEPRTRVRLSAERFDLEGWEEVVPLLGLATPSGGIALPSLEISSEPLSMTGRALLDGLTLRPQGREPMTLTGALDLRGQSLDAPELEMVTAGQTLGLSASVERIFDAPRFQVSIETAAADTNALLAAHAGEPDRVYGPLKLSAKLRGEFSERVSLLDSLEGPLDFGVDQGRIVGGSLLEAALGSLGSRLAEYGRKQGSSGLERFTGDDFEWLGGDLKVAGGRVRCDPLTLRYRGYQAELVGPIRLEDLGLDLRGTLTIHEDLDAALAKSFGADPATYQPIVRKVELTSVGGTLHAPKVQIAGSSAAKLASAYAQGVQRDELKRAVEKELGEGSGVIVDQVLDGLLGGGKQR